MSNRAKKLAGAHEIHRYKRDAGDLLARVQEKEASLPDDYDLGRNLGDVQNLISKQNVFEREIAALGTQVRRILFLLNLLKLINLNILKYINFKSNNLFLFCVF